MKPFHPPALSRSGFGMIEFLALTVISSILSMAFLANFKHQLKATRDIQNKNEFAEFSQKLGAVLSYRLSCSQSLFNGQTPPTTAKFFSSTFNFPPVEEPNLLALIKAGDVSIASVGQIYNTFKIEEIAFAEVGTGFHETVGNSTRYLASLTIRAAKTGSKLLQNELRYNALLWVTTNSSDVITECYAANSTGSSSGIANFKVYDDNGIFTVPPGVTTLEVEIWGGGGGGAGASHGNNQSSGGGGGGSGGFARGVFPTAPGTEYNVVVGVGGASGGIDEPGFDGSESTFSDNPVQVQLRSTGGSGGKAPVQVGNGNFHTTGIGGSGGWGAAWNVPSFTMTYGGRGENGAYNYADFYGASGGAGGTPPISGTGGPGAGGTGGSAYFSDFNQGTKSSTDGKKGRVVVHWQTNLL